MGDVRVHTGHSPPGTRALVEGSGRRPGHIVHRDILAAARTSTGHDRVRERLIGRGVRRIEQLRMVYGERRRVVVAFAVRDARHDLLVRGHRERDYQQIAGRRELQRGRHIREPIIFMDDANACRRSGPSGRRLQGNGDCVEGPAASHRHGGVDGCMSGLNLVLRRDTQGPIC